MTATKLNDHIREFLYGKWANISLLGGSENRKY
jgi:hypothetical protein